MQTARDPILRYVHDALRRLLPDGGGVLVAVSGGRDSIVLADAVRRLARPMRLDVTLAHVHHGLRGPEADADAAFVAGVARQWKLPFRSSRVRTESYRRRHRMSIEEAARALRYRALERMRHQARARLILTAHHADDQAETVLLRAARGAHRRGLAGILPVLQRPPVARPMLTISRSEIDRYARRRRLKYRDDASNDDLTFRRNLVRHRLLREVGRRLQVDAGSALPRLARAARSLGDSSDRILSQLERTALHSTRTVHTLDAARFQPWPEAVQNEILTRWLGRASLQPTNARINAATGLLSLPVGRWRPMGGAWRAYRERDGLSLVRHSTTKPATVALRPGRLTSIPGGRLRVVGPRPVPRSVMTPTGQAWVDADAVHGRLAARFWRPSDRIVPLGMSVPRKVSDLLTDRKVPAFRKRLVPVVLSGRRIVWVCGVAIDDRVKVRPATKQVLQFSFHSNV